MMNDEELLGAYTPLPRLVEEVLRYRLGLPFEAKRIWQFLKKVKTYLPSEDKAVAGVVRDIHPLLTASAMLSRNSPPPTPPDHTDDVAELAYAIAAFSHESKAHWYQQWWKNYKVPAANNNSLPSPILLLVFIHGLHHQWLSEADFRWAVLEANLLSPSIAPHRPLRNLNGLLDYLGISQQAFFNCLYRQLAAEIWPAARNDNWLEWKWITQPGGPELFTNALEHVIEEDISLTRLYELKYSPLPLKGWLTKEIAQLPVFLQLLLPLLRNVKSVIVDDNLSLFLKWLRESNIEATRQAYNQPFWWDDCLSTYYPQCKYLLSELAAISLPHPLLTKLVPDYYKISANLLLAKVASGEDISAVIKLAEDGDIPAIRALALMPMVSDRALLLLRGINDKGNILAKKAANRALKHLANSLGLPDENELFHRQLLTEAWNISPLAGERVRVGWQVGGYRIRIALRTGKILLEVIGPRGTMATLPPAVRQSESYQQARNAQHEAQRQYRLFRDYLEQMMLSEQPITSGEFHTLLANPIFAHLAERLIWHTADGRTFLWNSPGSWETYAGEAVYPAKNDALTLCITHPVILSQNKSLCQWQSLAADRRLIQPFKQIFREIYRYADDDAICQRFAGRKIDPVRAYALLRVAGFSPANGTARREWPGGIIAHICWAAGLSGRELFGPHRLPTVTCGDISFYHEKKPVAPATVNPIIVSETLRAADLLTTRAAVGDAELTSNETLLLRATLLRELARSLSLTNLVVSEQGRFALVLGKHATYRINLSNGNIMLEPEGRQIEAPQHQEMWQVTEENDTTSTIITIILTLAMDELIDDLTFLAQLS